MQNNLFPEHNEQPENPHLYDGMPPNVDNQEDDDTQGGEQNNHEQHEQNQQVAEPAEVNNGINQNEQIDNIQEAQEAQEAIYDQFQEHVNIIIGNPDNLFQYRNEEGIEGENSTESTSEIAVYKKTGIYIPIQKWDNEKLEYPHSEEVLDIKTFIQTESNFILKIFCNP